MILLKLPFISLLLLFVMGLNAQQSKTRLVILADMGNDMVLQNGDASKASITIPKEGKGKPIQMIYELKDNNSKISLSDYRRIIFLIK